jgi:hypothetical protein
MSRTEWGYILPSKYNTAYRRYCWDNVLQESIEEEIDVKDVPPHILEAERSILAQTAIDPDFKRRMIEDRIASRKEKPRYG